MTLETTQLRRLKAENARLRRKYAILLEESNRNLTRAIIAEKLSHEWQTRFDNLLKLGLKEEQ
jgi:hypothetical protein